MNQGLVNREQQDAATTKSTRVRSPDQASLIESESVATSESNGEYRIRQGWEFVRSNNETQPQQRSAASSAKRSTSKATKVIHANEQSEERKDKISEESKKADTDVLIEETEVTPEGHDVFGLKTFSVAEILEKFGPKRDGQNAFDFDNLLTMESLMSRSVSFGTWLCLLPLITTVWCVQSCFNLQIRIVRSVILTIFPGLPTDIQATTDRAIERTKDAVEPMAGILKTAVVRLAIVATIVTGCFIVSASIYAAIYCFVIPVSLQEAPLRFSLKTPETAKTDDSALQFAPRPALYCHFPIESALTEYQRRMTDAQSTASENDKPTEPLTDQEQFSSTSGAYIYENGSLKQQVMKEGIAKPQEETVAEQVRMDKENYRIEVVFDVAMSLHNYERGNLFVQSEFKSYRQGISPLTLSRTGYLNPKGSLTLTVKELVAMIPFVDYFYSCTTTEQVTIQIFERFDNEDFGLKTIDFLVPNEALQFKSARIRVKTSLSGVRYYMEEWFYTCALLVISTMTFIWSAALLVLILLAKRLYVLNWL